MEIYITMRIEEWSKWTQCEINHWDRVFDGYVNDITSYYHVYTKRRLDDKLKLHTNVQNLVDDIDKDQITILDVGSGPLPFLGKVSNKKLLFTAVDYLSHEYDKLYNKYNVHPSVKPIQCDALELTNIFSKNQFDIVYARNSIDHTFNPIKCIQQMVHVCNKHLILEHKLNEGIVENYQGLHQWNFFTKDSKFYISDKYGIEYCVNDYLSVYSISCQIVIEEEENISDWLVINIKK
jgi:ubiquinone/menaquinone biosynthesis C-methylase UbiE